MNAPTKSPQQPGHGLPSSELSSSTFPPISYAERSSSMEVLFDKGARGAEVIRLQKMLNAYFKFTNSQSRVDIDGIYGSETENAVKLLQKQTFSISIDSNLGKVTRRTWDILAGYESDYLEKQKEIAEAKSFIRDPENLVQLKKHLIEWAYLRRQTTLVASPVLSTNLNINFTDSSFTQYLGRGWENLLLKPGWNTTAQKLFEDFELAYFYVSDKIPTQKKRERLSGIVKPEIIRRAIRNNQRNI
jgi:peptidoglycan hydrolase-like protein with peptidoglycan-binding domain